MRTNSLPAPRVQRPAVNYISALRFPLAFLVVLIHVYGSVWQASASPGLDPWASLLCKDFPSFAVPLFFAISGFLFFYRKPHPTLLDYRTKFRRRVSTLLLPYLAWNVLAFALYALKDCLGGQPIQIPFSLHLFWDARINGAATENVWGQAVGATPAPVLLPLWFVRNLIVVTLLSPLLQPLLRLRWGLGLLLLGGVYYAQLWPNFFGLDFNAFWFFSLGAWCSLHEKEPLALTRPLALPAAIITPLALAGLCLASRSADEIPLLAGLLPPSAAPLAKSAENLPHSAGFIPLLDNLFQQLYILGAMVLALHAAGRFCRSHSPSPFLSQSSFFLYACHTILLLPLAGKLAPLSAPWPLPLQLLTLLFAAALATALSLLLFYLLRRFLPRASSLLTGVRA